MRNRYGVDTAYFERELDALKASLEDRTPEELRVYFLRLANIVSNLENISDNAKTPEQKFLRVIAQLYATQDYTAIDMITPAKFYLKSLEEGCDCAMPDPITGEMPIERFKCGCKEGDA